MPANRTVESRSIEVHRTFLGLRLSSKEVFDLDPTWDDLKRCLSSYSLAQMLDLSGRVSAVLATGPAGDPEIQRNLVFAIFGSQAAGVWTAVETARAQWAREGELHPTVVVFDELQLVNLIKVAFLLLPLTSDLGEGDSPEGFGRALLMLNALIDKDPSSLSVPDLSTDAGWRQALYHLFVNGIFHHGEFDLHVLARCYDLYLSDKPHLAECSAYVDLPALVRSATGLEPDGFWAVLFALLGHTISIARTPATTAPIHRRTYFTRNFRFTTEESERFFAFAAGDARTIRDEIANVYSLSSIKPFHILPVAQHPLVSLGEYIFCPSRRLLFEALTHGLYHRLLNARSSEADRSRFQTYIGYVFEDYVDRLLHRTFGGAPSTLVHRHLDAADLRRAVPSGKLCDGLVLYGDAVVLVESKAKLLKLGARAGEDIVEYEMKLDEIVVDAGKQVLDTINAIERGRLRSLGIVPEHVRTYYPLVVTLDSIPMRTPIYNRLVSHLPPVPEAARALVRPLQIVDVGELVCCP